MTTRHRAMTGLALGSSLLIFLACDHSPTESSGSPVVFQTVVKTSLPGFPDLQGQETVRDRATWQAVWAELHTRVPEPLPEVDFSREMVVVAVGPGCGGEVTISSIVRERGELVVNGHAKSCSNRLCVIADFSTHVVRLPRSEAPVRLRITGDGKIC